MTIVNSPFFFCKHAIFTERAGCPVCAGQCIMTLCLRKTHLSMIATIRHGSKSTTSLSFKISHLWHLEEENNPVLSFMKKDAFLNIFHVTWDIKVLRVDYCCTSDSLADYAKLCITICVKP